jgi:DNA topoisomerase-2
LQKSKAKTVPKKTPAPKASKPATKKMTQTTLALKSTALKKRAKPESDDDEEGVPSEVSFGDGSGLSNTPPNAKKQKKAPTTNKSGASKPLQSIHNESMQFDDESDDAPVTKKGPSKKKTATDQYQRLTQLEHIVKRPDTYIGSVEQTTEQMWGRSCARPV